MGAFERGIDASRLGLNLLEKPRVDKLRKPLEWFAGGILPLAVIALGAVSFLTTMNGLHLALPLTLALPASFGNQAAMFIAGVVWSDRRRSGSARMCAAGALALSLMTSVFFSFAALRHHLAIDVATVRAPFILRHDKALNEARLSNFAIQFKGSAMATLQSQEASAQGAYEQARQQLDWARIRAVQERAAIDQAQQQATQLSHEANPDTSQLAQLRSVETTARRRLLYLQNVELHAGALMRLQQNRLGQIHRVSQQVGQLDADSSVVGTDKQLQAWVAAWSMMPLSFQRAHPMPTLHSVPESPIPAGYDESIVAALQTLRHPKPSDWFALFLASLFDLIPMLAVLSTATGERLGIAGRLRAIHAWMRQVRVELDSSDGFFPWLGHVFKQAVWGTPVYLEDPAFAKFLSALDSLDTQRQKLFAQIALPEAIKTIVGERLGTLHARLQILAFRRSNEMRNATDLAIADVILQIEAAPELTPQQKDELQRFLKAQIHKLKDAIGRFDSMK